MTIEKELLHQQHVSTKPSKIFLMKQLWLALEQGKLFEAQGLAEQLISVFSHYADSWYAVSVVYLNCHEDNKALAAIDRAINIEPKNMQWQLHKAQLLVQSRKQVQAIELVTELQQLSLGSVDDCAQLALLCNTLSLHRQADSLYRRAIKLANEQAYLPRDNLAQLYFNLASIKRYLGEIDKAESLLGKAISLNPNDCEAYLQRSSLKKQTPGDNHIKELTGKLKQLALSSGDATSQSQLAYALAKEHEDLKAYENSFKALTYGANSRRGNIQYRIQGDIDTLDSIRQVYDLPLFKRLLPASQLRAKQGDGSAEAIFILGLPRTGSTLVERILGNHQLVHSAGELNNFAFAMIEQCKNVAASSAENRRDLVKLSQQLDFAQLGLDYLNSTRPDTGHTAHFIDKLPLNSLYVGLIHLALPNAKIIHVKRHPMDTCYAIYKQLFTSGYPFSYDLNELGQYFIAHQQLMSHWHKVLPGVMHTVNYEDVLADLPGQAKELIDYCGLDWQEGCVDFQHNRQASTTASASQVRQRLYQTSKGRWLSYETQLAPLRKQLEAAGIDCS